MSLIADILLIAGAIGAAIYCMVLSRRLSRFNNLEKGMGGAIAVLSAQVDDMTKSLNSAQTAANGSTTTLADLTARAEAATSRLELMMASLHDLERTEAKPTKVTVPAATAADFDSFAAAPAAPEAPPVEPVEGGTLFLSRRVRVNGAAS